MYFENKFSFVYLNKTCLYKVVIDVEYDRKILKGGKGIKINIFSHTKRD